MQTYDTTQAKIGTQNKELFQRYSTQCRTDKSPTGTISDTHHVKIHTPVTNRQRFVQPRNKTYNFPVREFVVNNIVKPSVQLAEGKLAEGKLPINKNTLNEATIKKYRTALSSASNNRFVEAQTQADINKDIKIGGNIGYKSGLNNPQKYVVKSDNGNLLTNLDEAKINSEIGAWVLDYNGTLYGPQTDGPGFGNMLKHEQAPVIAPAWAGEMNVKDGKVKCINNKSGTHRLTDTSNLNILAYLHDAGVITYNQLKKNQIKIDDWTQTGHDRVGKLQTWMGFTGTSDVKDIADNTARNHIVGCLKFLPKK